MLLKRISSLLLLILVISNSFAQKNLEDVVYLINGSIIRGHIIEYIPESHVKIETVGGNVWVFKAIEIKNISKEEKYKALKEYSGFHKGYFNHTNIGFLIGSYDNYWYSQVAGFSFQITNGYQMNKRFTAAITSGFEFLDVPYIPFMLDGRYDFLDKRLTPYGAVQAGYSLPLDGEQITEWMYNYKGGYILNFEIGLKNNFSDNTALMFGIGYRRQEMNSYRFDDTYNTEIRRINIYNRINFRIGFLFK